MPTPQAALRRRQLLLAGAALALPGLARAANPTLPWPDRPVRILVGFPPGGPTDVVARLIAPGLAAAWGTQVIIENKGGTLAGAAMPNQPTAS